MKSNAEVDFEINAEDMEILKNFKKIESYGESGMFVIGGTLTILSWDNPVTAFLEKVKSCATALAGHRAAISFTFSFSK